VAFEPLDIRYQEFRRRVRGYDVEEVRAYLAELADYVSSLKEELAACQKEVERLKGELARSRAEEAELKRAVVAAEKIAREVKAQAEREAELILKEAQAAKEKALREAVEQLARMRGELERLKKERELFKNQFKGLLLGYLESLDKESKP